MIEESISERNSMQKPYRYWTQEEIFEPLTEEQLKAADKRRKELQAKHYKQMIDVWEEL